MSPFVVDVLKYVFLGFLYFFVFRAIRAVAVDAVGRRRDRRAQTAETRPLPQPRPARRSRTPTALVIRGEDGRKRASHRLSTAIQIGRAEACHVRLDDRYASQYHAKVYPRDGAWYAEDMGSTNGTYLNQQRLTSAAEVHAGDVLRIGKTTLELRR